MRSQLMLCAALGVALFGPSLQGATVLPADFPEMVRGSQVIVHGRVRAVESYVAADTVHRTRAIETRVTLDVVSPLKGVTRETVVFRVPGGQVGRYRRIMPGAPVFAEGDEVFIFLQGRPPAVPMPFGLSQGVYRVARAAEAPVVTPLIPPAAGRAVRGDPARRPLALEAFVREVRALMERP